MKSLAVLQVETTNLCQAKCVFCPHSRFTEFGTMTDELYIKIIEEASHLPALTHFIPMLTGEPFCDKKILERIELARARMPWVFIEIYTNGSLLTFEIMQRLSKITNFGLTISLNGLNPDTRKKLMGLDDWIHVVRMCKYAEQIKVPYHVLMVAYPEIKLDEIQNFIKAGGIAIQNQSWAGEMYPYKRNRWTSCVRALHYMTIRYNGDANLCCFDPFGKVSFGNLNNQSIEEIWYSKKRQEYMIKHREGRGNFLSLCDSCTEA